MRHAILHSKFDYAGGASATEHVAHMAEAWLNQGDDIALFTHHPVVDLGPLAPFAANGQLRHTRVLAAERPRGSHLSSDVVVARTLGRLRDLKPDVLHLTHWTGLVGVALEAIRTGLCPATAIPYDFGLSCFRVHLLEADDRICSGPEAAKCGRCIERCETRSWLGRAAWALPPKAARVLRPTYEWSTLSADIERHVDDRRELLAGLSAVFAPSVVMRDACIAHGAVPSRCHHLPYGVADAKIGDGRKSSATRLRLGYFGHAAPYKGVGFLGRVLGALPDGLPLSVVLFVPDTWEYAQREWSPAARAYASRGSFVRAHQMASAYRDLEAVVVPSQWHENSPFVVLESLANRTPVIAADQQGIAEHIRHGENGFLLAAGDIDAWRALLVRASAEPALLSDLQPACDYRLRAAEYARRVRSTCETLRGGATDGSTVTVAAAASPMWC